MTKRFAVIALTTLVAGIGCARDRARPAAATMPATMPAVAAAIDPVIDRIRAEGLERSQVMDTLDHLTNVIGPRLTASPQLQLANEWTRDRLAEWGLADAHLEAWGPFGRGWRVDRFSMQVVAPTHIAIAGYPKAWSPGLDGPAELPVIFLDARRASDFEAYRGGLKDAIVLVGQPRTVDARFEPMATRMTEDELDSLARYKPGQRDDAPRQPRQAPEPANERRARFAAQGGRLGAATTTTTTTSVATSREATTRRAAEVAAERRAARSATAPSTTMATTAPTTVAATSPSTGPSSQPTTTSTDEVDDGIAFPASGPATRPRPRGFDPLVERALKFAAEEGAAVVATASWKGDGGTFFVQGASIPGAPPRNGDDEPTTRPRVWSDDAPAIVPQVTLGVEDFNRLARMARRGERITAAIDMRTSFHGTSVMPSNTIAEIPGTDLAHEVVMIGAHLDSWHAGTGATDNAVGSACAMEAVRIIRALGLKPRRTIRVALWSGEEQGLYGSEAYVKRHFGHLADDRATTRSTTMATTMSATGPTTRPSTRPSTRRSRAERLIKGPGYERLSAYFNLDNGTGRIRGIWAQGNKAAVPLFKQWIAPFADLDASTVTLHDTGGTDHLSFDDVGLPGFQFIQDSIEYSPRTHHSNQDNFDRIQADDMRQASTIMAAFVWQAANMDERFPRKPLVDNAE